MPEKISILVADDHTVVREGLRALIETEPGMEMIGEATDGLDAIEQARRLQPDVILLDLVMPKRDGIEAIGEITRDNSRARILILTSFAEDEKIYPAIKAGALGYLLKDSSPQELLQAIRDVHRGEPSLHPTIARKIIRELSRPPEQSSASEQLSEPEFQVLGLLARGLSNKEIADTLDIEGQKAYPYIGSILDKLHLASRTQRVLVEPPQYE